jgi:hypothetical protein
VAVIIQAQMTSEELRHDTRLIAALLTVALNSVKPRMTPQQMGKQDWQHVVSEYQEILQSLESIPER